MRKERGQALVAVLVTTAVLVGTLYAISARLRAALGSQRNVQSHSDTFLLDDSVNLLLNNPDLCKKGLLDAEQPKPKEAYFDPQGSISPEKQLNSLALGPTMLVSSGGLYDVISVGTLALQELDPSLRMSCVGSNIYRTQLSIPVSRSRTPGGTSLPTRTFPLWLQTDASTGQIIGCSAQAITCGCTPMNLDFENAQDPMGKALGLTFSNDGGMNFIIADTTKKGKDVQGFLNDGKGIWDQMAANKYSARSGTHFLATDGIYDTKIKTLNITVGFGSPIASFSADIYDIDGYERWTVVGYDANGNPAASTSVKHGDPGTGDAKIYTVQIGTSTARIVSVLFQGDQPGRPGGYNVRYTFGYGIDNIAFSACPNSFPPTFQGSP